MQMGEEVESGLIYGNAASLYKFKLKYWYAENVKYL